MMNVGGIKYGFKQAGGERINDNKVMVPVPMPRKTLLRPPLVVLVPFSNCFFLIERG